MKRYNKDDYIREFELEHNRSISYFNYMYKVQQFSFAAIIATVVAASSLFNGNQINIENIKAIILGYVLPVFTYVFGVMYAYNAYALSVCGKRAEYLHKKIYSVECSSDDPTITDDEKTSKISTYDQTDEQKNMTPYVYTNRIITLLSYGLQLMFYLAFPLTCNIFSILLCKTTKYFFFYKVLPFVLTALYLIIMVFIIVQICGDFFIKQNEIIPKILTLINVKSKTSISKK